ncbi:MAG: exonuclease domain-containing protein [Eubacterium sp.]|nr:exonuclease domain-containing protein [Eubacterium sp.]
MDYIVFDLEWNQCPYGKEREVARLPFEIIEIGAVKLDSSLKQVSTYHTLINPKVYRTLHYRTREIVGLTTKDLKQGKPFETAVREFFSWAGPEAVFCTWGTTDLTELQRNLSFYGLLHLFKGPCQFLNVQKLFAIQYENTKSRRSLEYAVDFLKLEKDENFHRALADAEYTGRILSTIDPSVILSCDSIDTYQNPTSKENEIHAVYNGYSKYISRSFPTKEEAMADKEVRSTYCCVCGREAKKKLRWFSTGTRAYYCTAVCPVHGYIKGKIKTQHAMDGGIFVIKTIKVSYGEEAEAIQQKKEALRVKRRKARHKE